MAWQNEVEAAWAAFENVAKLAGEPISKDEVEIEFLPAPHQPPRLPKGKTAVYGFWGNGVWLKVGQVGEKGGPRYTSHHYRLTARSTLSKSLANGSRT